MDTAARRLRILIVSYSRFGALAVLAEQIAAGARSVEGTEVHVWTDTEASPD